MFIDNPYSSKRWLVNNLSSIERTKLRDSLLDTDVKILADPIYGLFTEHGFPVAMSYYSEKDIVEFPNEFFAHVIKTRPMVTIDDFPK